MVIKVYEKEALIFFLNEVQRYELDQGKSFERGKLPQKKFGHTIKDKNGRERRAYHYIIACLNEEKAIEFLDNDHSLDFLRTNPVVRISGPETENLPNTTQLRSKDYNPVGNLIGEIRSLRWSGKGKGEVNTAELIDYSPVAIYQASSRMYYTKSQETELRAHLESRMRELGLI